MRLRTAILGLIGVVIISGAVASTAVPLACNQCGGDGRIECSSCGGVGAVLGFPVSVECACKGENPGCLFCGGIGAYLQFTIAPCPVCDGKGGESCPVCGGDGKVGANQRLLKLLNLK